MSKELLDFFFIRSTKDSLVTGITEKVALGLSPEASGLLYSMQQLGSKIKHPLASVSPYVNENAYTLSSIS